MFIFYIISYLKHTQTHKHTSHTYTYISHTETHHIHRHIHVMHQTHVHMHTHTVNQVIIKPWAVEFNPKLRGPTFYQQSIIDFCLVYGPSSHSGTWSTVQSRQMDGDDARIIGICLVMKQAVRRAVHCPSDPPWFFSPVVFSQCSRVVKRNHDQGNL